MAILWLYYGYPTVGYQPDTYWALFRFLRIIVHFCCFYKKMFVRACICKKKVVPLPRNCVVMRKKR